MHEISAWPPSHAGMGRGPAGTGRLQVLLAAIAAAQSSKLTASVLLSTTEPPRVWQNMQQETQLTPLKWESYEKIIKQSLLHKHTYEKLKRNWHRYIRVLRT